MLDLTTGYWKKQ